MDTTVLQIIWTVVAIVFFIGVVVWALSSRRKADFDKASIMAIDDEEPVSKEQSRDH